MNPDTLTRYETRGYRVLNQKASFMIQLAAAITDVSSVFSLFCICLLLTHSEINPRPFWIPCLILSLIIYQIGFRGVFGRTPGQWIWRLGRPLDPHTQSRKSAPLLQYQTLGLPLILSASTLTLASLLSAAHLGDRTFLSLPFWMKANSVELTPKSTPEGDAIPFFYSLGFWPIQYQDSLIQYRLPYEKGPPEHFIGHVIANWTPGELPPITLTFEGPKTPVEGFTRQQILHCMQNPFSWNCIRVRQRVLARPTQEATHKFEEDYGEKIESWDVTLFLTRTKNLSPEEKTQGLILTALSPSYRQDRYLVITPKGTLQSFILDTPRNLKGEEARSFFENSISTLSISDDLSSGVAWINERLKTLDLSSLQSKTELKKTLQNLVEVQTLLLSKLTIDPKVYDTYFYLAQVSADLLRKVTPFISQNEPQSGSLHLREISAAAKGLIESSYQYALDINPQEPRNVEIYQLKLDPHFDQRTDSLKK